MSVIVTPLQVLMQLFRRAFYAERNVETATTEHGRKWAEVEALAMRTAIAELTKNDPYKSALAIAEREADAKFRIEG